MLRVILSSFLIIVMVSFATSEEESGKNQQIKKSLGEAIDGLNGMFSKRDLCQMLNQMEGQGYVNIAKRYLSFLNINPEEIWPLVKQYLKCDY